MARSLAEVRKEWEEGLHPLMTVVRGEQYPVVFVLLKDPGYPEGLDRFFLYRYFPVGDGWEVSGDLQNRLSIYDCLKELDLQFQSAYPKESE